MLSLSRHARRAAVVACLLLPGAAGAQAPSQASQIDYILVRKAERTMTLYAEGRPVRVISGIQLGRQPVGPKRFQGDQRTPEGRYTIDYGNRDSGYYLSLHISYPNAEDAARARAQGRSPGGLIFIHGQPNDWEGPGARVPGDWTDGCIAVSDDEMAALWETVPDGAMIDIVP